MDHGDDSRQASALGESTAPPAGTVPDNAAAAASAAAVAGGPAAAADAVPAASAAAGQPEPHTVSEEEDEEFSLPGFIGTVITWIIVSVLVFLAAAAVVVPQIMGWVPLTVLTGSMEPRISPGSLVVVKPVDTTDGRRELSAGQIATYMPNPDDPTLVTHRIIDRSTRTDGTVFYKFKGDANQAPDPDEVADFQVRATYRYHLPYLGYVTGRLHGKQRTGGVLIVVAILLTYMVYQLYQYSRERRRLREEEEGQKPDSPACA
nr:signal peptidase I [Corynebacterium mendelii]